MLFRNGALSRRDAFLLLIGASSMHIWSLVFGQHGAASDQSISLSQENPTQVAFTTTVRETKTRTQGQTQTQTQTQTVTATATPTSMSRAILPYDELPPTELLAHAPGWTLFRNLYMSNGTIFLVADEKDRQKFPEIRMITSTGLEALNTPENIAMREPTERDMCFITPEQARARWVSATAGKGLNRVWTVEGNTLLFNDPKQFLRHYYHFVAELFFGVQAFWHGAFSLPITPSDALEPSSPHFSISHPPAPPIHRAIFIHSNADGWRDSPGFNSYFLRAVLPSLSVEHEEDWADRAVATRPRTGQTDERAWHFPLVLFTDRSAAHRGPICGSQTQRTAAEAWDFMRVKGKLRGIHVGGWWAPLREAMWRFAGAEEGLKTLALPSISKERNQQAPLQPLSDGTEVIGIDTPTPADHSKIVNVDSANQKVLAMPDKVVVSYISRQSARNRKLIKEDHEGMVQAVQELVDRKNKERKEFMDAMETLGIDEVERRRKRDSVEKGGIPPAWEFNELEAEKLTKDEQIKAAARTTIMLGVHGNGLTHLVFMDPKRVSAVIEIFYPGGFAHDYQWTTRALGMSHFAVWNDTHHSYPDKPNVDYPDGFQGNEIPVYGPAIAQLIEDRVAGKL